MNPELMAASAALASLMALTHWAQCVATRAWGDGVQGLARKRAWATALVTLVLQTVTAVAAAGHAAGAALVVSAWMVLGWLLVLAMNHWPAASLRWGRRLGALGGAGCLLALAWHILQGLHF